ncbi:MAG: glycoside hydrolase family 31 protein [Candidatus Hydrogenedentes bacterium]|nr:glycoside hydrolase family 31 protein [Candidatus Hydrogenedentota bacterium]
MIRRWARRILFGVLVFAVLLAVVFVCYVVYPVWGLHRLLQTRHVPVTPSWALEPWVWEDDVNTADFVRELLAGYEEQDFPVRTVLIDSPWSTRYNDFTVDAARYPEPEKFFRELQGRGYRVVLWMTCMVDSSNADTTIRDSSDWYAQVAEKGYLAGGDRQLKWWKGRGGLIDYTHPEAMSWWHGLQQNVFDWGIDGWKLDDTATFFSSSLGPVPIPYGNVHGGLLTTRAYMDHYYRDEYRHGLTQNPEFITLARAIDDNAPYVHPNGFAPLDAAPVCWVGDQDHTWTAEEEGLDEALDYILRSAEKGYGIVGSDIGGYGGPKIPPALYIRWAQFSTFCGLFLNGGHGERRLWERTPRELEIIRKFAWLHSELVPYIWEHMYRQHEGTGTVMTRAGDDFEYYFGPDLFVAPLHREANERTVSLPGGPWRYLFDDLEVLEGPQTFTRTFPLEEYPVYVRDGAILPMNVRRDYTGIGDSAWENKMTLNLYPRGASELHFRWPDTKEVITCAVKKDAGLSIQVDFAASPRPFVLRVLSANKPREVKCDAALLPENEGWTYDAPGQRLVILQDQPQLANHYTVVH